MNKAEFVEKLSKEMGITKAEAGRNLDMTLKCIVQSVKENNKLKFIDFGVFQTREIKAKNIKTPRGVVVKVPAHRKVVFSVGKEFKEVVNEK